MNDLKFDKNRKRVKYCPCGKSNRDGKFVPFVGHDSKGYCHSCLKTISPETEYKPITRDHYEQPSYHSCDLVLKHGKNFKHNNFVQFLLARFGEDAVSAAILAYNIGTSERWPGSTVFWQIDKMNRVRAGKVMLYDSRSGKNVKEPFRHVSWVHGADFNLNQCLFGLHLITNIKPDFIALVESEKTAIIMALTYPEKSITWMATGGKGNFRREFLNPIKDLPIIAYPDKGEYNIWLSIASELNNEGFEIDVDTTLEDMPFKAGTDFADLIIEDSVVQSESEIQVKKLAKLNPTILSLIEEFDLVDDYGNSVKD